MKACRWIPLFLALCAGSAVASGVENMVALKIGMTWPWAVVEENSRIKLCGDGGVEFGYFFDRKFGIGFAGDFFWNRVGDENVDTLTVRYTLSRERKSFMFPIGAFAVIDPMPDWIVHPAAKFQIGYNSLVYGIKVSTHDTLDYYFGLFIRTGLDAVCNIGENTAVFAGADYQWARTRTPSDRNHAYKRRDMGGIGIHIGFRALY